MSEIKKRWEAPSGPKVFWIEAKKITGHKGSFVYWECGGDPWHESILGNKYSLRDEIYELRQKHMEEILQKYKRRYKGYFSTCYGSLEFIPEAFAADVMALFDELFSKWIVEIDQRVMREQELIGSK